MKMDKKTKLKIPKVKALIAMLFGLGAALFWHFAHAAHENYSPDFSDWHFWLHLLTEGMIALYAFAITLIVWLVLERMKQS
jgi:hypothetical protein